MEDRNRFVHHLVEEASKIASDEDPEAYSRDFSKQMLEDSIRLMELFFAKFLSWYQALQPNEPMDEETKRQRCAPNLGIRIPQSGNTQNCDV